MPFFFDSQIEMYVWSSGFILLTVLLVKYWLEKKLLRVEAGRKMLHIIAILICGYVVHFSVDIIELASIFIGFSIVLFYIAHHNLLLPNERRSYGIALFPLAFGVLLLTPFSKDAILFAIVTLGISDALAGWAGETFAKNKVVFLYENKSWLGFFVFYFSTLVIATGFIGFSPVIFLLALIPAVSELYSYRGSDNLTVPLMAAFWYDLLHKTTISYMTLVTFFIMAIILMLVYYKRWLSDSGTMAAFLLSSLILFSSGVVYLLPISIFFVAGSLTTRLIPKNKDANGRDAFQVFANGGVATICLLLFSLSQNDVFLLGYFASVCISLADTMSSDIGIFFRQKTYDILTFAPSKVGLSGGISLVGTVAGILSAILFSGLLMWVFSLTMIDMVLISVTGFSGMLLDSVLGSLWQAKYVNDDIITEEKTSHGKLMKGFDWMDNDGVNLLSNFMITMIFVILVYVL